MKDRIKEIMDNEDLTPARFADKLQINRAVVSHILNGRNNPSLDVVIKILSEMDYINSDWLLNGIGSMYKEGYTASESVKRKSLFDLQAINADNSEGSSEYPEEKHVKHAPGTTDSTDKQQVNHTFSANKKIKEIIIYYTDNTFESFIPH